MKRQLTFKFFDTQEQAEQFEKTIARHLRGNVAPWTSQNGKEHKWIAWYRD